VSTPAEGCLLVGVIDRCLPILLDSMFCLAPLSCPPSDAALDSFDLRDADGVRARHPYQSHPRPVAATAHLLRFAAH
jgi:hypothetical protein